MRPTNLGALLITVMFYTLGLAMPTAQPNDGISVVRVGDAVLEARETTNNTFTERGTIATFTAYTGSHCDTGRGGDVNYGTDKVCTQTSGRHSFSIGLRCASTRVIVYAATQNCYGQYSYDLGSLAPGCYNVNTGNSWDSAWYWCN